MTFATLAGAPRPAAFTWLRDRLTGVSGREALLDDARTAYGRNDWTVARSRAARCRRPAAARSRRPGAAGLVVPVGGRRGGVPERARAGRGGLRRGRRCVRRRRAWPWSRRASTCRCSTSRWRSPASSGRMELLEGEPESPEHAQAMWMLSFTADGGGRRRGSAGVAPGGACDRSSGGQPRPGGDGGAGAGAHRGHRGGPERGAAAPRRGRRAGHAARGRADPRRLRVLRGDLDLSGALRLGAGDGVDEHVDPLLRARVDRRLHGAVPLPPGRDRPPPRSAGPGRGAGAAGVRGAAGGQPLQRRVGLQRAGGHPGPSRRPGRRRGGARAGRGLR